MSQTPNNSTAPSQSDGPAETADHRRGFFVKAAATVIGAILVVFPFAAGLAVFFSPLIRKPDNEEDASDDFIRVTTLDAIPEGGVPRRFPVRANHTDAWNRFLNVPIGSVYLRRNSDGKVEALNTICPHAGCFVNFDQHADCYKCPCHNSFFKLDGEMIEPSPSPRGMDTLTVKETPNGDATEVWVKFENFYTGIEEKKVKS